MTLRIGSRSSVLARWQAEHVKSRLARLHADDDVEINWIHTRGDRVRDVPLARIGDKGLFTKQIDQALLDDRVDLAVHSYKDIPTRLAEGLALGAVLPREDPRDAFLPAPDRDPLISALPAGSVIGTSSLRRRAQLLHYRPDLHVEDLRGNLDTRLRRLHENNSLAGAILAVAGLRRIGREDAIGEILDPPDWLPAVGQGALCVVIREDDGRMKEALKSLDHAATRRATEAERSFLRTLEGGCQIPIGALAKLENGRMRLRGVVASLNGREWIQGEEVGDAMDAEHMGRALALRLVERGAATVLEKIREWAPGGLPRASAP